MLYEIADFFIVNKMKRDTLDGYLNYYIKKVVKKMA